MHGPYNIIRQMNRNSAFQDFLTTWDTLENNNRRKVTKTYDSRDYNCSNMECDWMWTKFKVNLQNFQPNLKRSRCTPWDIVRNEFLVPPSTKGSPKTNLETESHRYSDCGFHLALHWWAAHNGPVSPHSHATRPHRGTTTRPQQQPTARRAPTRDYNSVFLHILTFSMEPLNGGWNCCG